jgi:hypothetical protein
MYFINNFMKYTIYKVTNNINGKIYIGKHQTENPDDGYYGSGVALKNSIKKHGKNNFTKEVLHIFESEEEMNMKEVELITEEFVSRKDTYNMGVGGEGGAHFKGKTHTPETIAKLKKANEIRTPAQIEASLRVGRESKGRKLSEQAKENMRQAQEGKYKGPMAEEIKQKISESLKGRKLSEQAKENKRQAMKGNTNAKNHSSEEYKKKQSEAMKAAWERRKQKTNE